jgi:hypothetical protein
MWLTVARKRPPDPVRVAYHQTKSDRYGFAGPKDSQGGSP